MTTPGQPSVEEAIAVLEEGHREMMKIVAAIPKDSLDQPGAIGDWSIKDLIGHIATWEELALRTIEEWNDRQPPTVEEIIGVQGGVDRFNALEIEKHRQSTAAETLER